MTKRARAETEATVEWIDGNLGSKLTMKYPAVVMTGPKAHGEVLSVAYAGAGQHQDAGAKMTHAAPETTSIIDSKSISKDGGRTTYRGLVRVEEGAHNVKSHVRCDALILDEESRSDTYPYMEIEEKDARIGHEATVSKVGDDQLFYLRSRGLTRAAGHGDDRERLHRADREDAPDGVRGRAVAPHRAQHGRRGRLMPARNPMTTRSLPMRRGLSAGRTGSWRAGVAARPSSWPASPGRRRPRRSGATAASTSSTSTATAPFREDELGRAGDERAPGGGPWAAEAGAHAAMIVVRDGRVVHHELDPALEAKGVRACGIATCDDPRSASLLGHACRSATPDAFTALHDAFLAGGAFIDVPAGVVVEEPILVLHWCEGDGRASFPHTLVHARRRSARRPCSTASARPRPIISSTRSPSCIVGDNAHLRYLSVQEHGPRTWHLGFQRADLGRDATLRTSAVALGGDYARLRSEARLGGQGGESDQLAVYFGDGTQMLDFRTLQDHDAPCTRSDLLFKGAVEDEAALGVLGPRPPAEARAEGERAPRPTATSCSPKARARSRSRTSRSRRTTCGARTRRPSARSTTTSSTTSSRRGIAPDEAERLIVLGFFDDVFAPAPGRRADAAGCGRSVVDKLEHRGASWVTRCVCRRDGRPRAGHGAPLRRRRPSHRARAHRRRLLRDRRRVLARRLLALRRRRVGRRVRDRVPEARLDVLAEDR